jgi:hypothetical protein
LTMEFTRTKDPLTIPVRPGILRILPAGKTNWTSDLVYSHHCLNMQVDSRLMQQMYPDCTFAYHEFTFIECKEYKYPRRKLVKT